ncbi:MAG: hypothetical protein PHV62_03195 [Sulfuricurvum sp.]|nr:hypothetical protein [Sulfuricurvum sp.]
MTINTNLLVSAAMLQDYLVDKDTGMPLAGGIISLYKDNARSFYKNWYYQTGTPGAYEWVALDNPLALSSVGTIQDPNGNDVIPFFYPYEEDNSNITEPYYITVYSVDENGDPDILQFTRENFPFVPSNNSPTVTNPTWRNYILNNIYWRNIGSLDCMNVTDQVIAPSQHEGYTNGDIRFRKNVTGADDDLIFSPMTTALTNDITPEFYIGMQCTGVQVGETLKCIQYPISLHVKTLNSVSGVIKFHGQNVAGNVNNYVDLYFYQFLGTGAISQPDPVLIQRVTLNNDFEVYPVPFITPSTEGLTLGSGGDDALFLLVQFPLSATFNINHTKPQIFFSPDYPDNDFDTYDQVEAIINSPRTGDYRTSLNPFTPFGWVPANDGSIGSAASSATSRANIDTWPLYNLLWNNVLDHWAPVSTGRGASAYADFTANKKLTLTRNLGRVIAGMAPMTTSLGVASPSVTFTADTGTDVLTLTSARNLLTGMPVQVANSGGALPTPLAANTVYFVSVNSLTTTTIKLSTTIENAYAGTDIDITVAGTGTQTLYPALGSYLGETNHTLTTGEVPNLNVTVTQQSRDGAPTGGGNIMTATGALTGYFDNITGATTNGGGGAHNTMQPSMYGMVFIKL